MQSPCKHCEYKYYDKDKLPVCINCYKKRDFQEQLIANRFNMAVYDVVEDDTEHQLIGYFGPMMFIN